MSQTLPARFTALTLAPNASSSRTAFEESDAQVLASVNAPRADGLERLRGARCCESTGVSID